MTDEIEQLKTERDDWYMRALKAEDDNERLRALSVNNAHSWDDIVRERDELRAEIERLRSFEWGWNAEIERLRAEIEQLLTLLQAVETIIPNNSNTARQLRRTLEQAARSKQFGRKP